MANSRPATRARRLLLLVSMTATAVAFLAPTAQAATTLTVTKSAVPAEGGSVTPGTTIAYSIDIANSGLEDATDVTLTDATPANTTYVDGSATIDGGAPIAGGNPFADGENLGTVAAGDTVTVTFDVTVDAGVADGTTITNNASVTAVNVDPNTSDLDDDAVHTVIAPVLAVDKTSTPAEGETVDPGATIDYSIVITNSGGDAATAAKLTDNTPENTQYVAGSATIDDGTGAQPVPDNAAEPLNPFSDPGFDLGDIPAGETRTASFQVTVNSPLPNDTVISNSAVVTASNHGEVSDTADLTVTSTPGLTMAKTAFPAEGGPVTPGAVISYTIVVTNAAEATGTATEATLTDPTPAFTTYVEGSAKLGDTAIEGQGNPLAEGYALPDLAPGESATVTFDVKVVSPLSKGTVISNLAKLTAANHPDVEDGATHTVDSAPVLKVSVVSDPPPSSKVKAGQTIAYDVKISNDPAATDSLQSVTVTAPTPEGTSFVEGSLKVDGVPVTSAGRLAAAAASGTNPLASGYALGNIAPGATRSLAYSFEVKRSADAIDGTLTVAAANVSPVTATTSHRGPASGSGGGGGGGDDDGSAFGIDSESETSGGGSGELAFTGLDMARLLTLAMSLFLIGWTLLARGRSVQRRTATVSAGQNPDITPGFPAWDRWSGAWFFPDSKR